MTRIKPAMTKAPLLVERGWGEARIKSAMTGGVRHPVFAADP